MNRLDKFLIIGSGYAIGTIILFFTGSFLGFFMIIPGILYTIFGGKKHV